MEAVRITLYALTIVSATVTWALAAAFLALTHIHLGYFWRGDVALLVFGILAMLILPCLMCLGFGHRRKSLRGPTIAETLAVFTFWCLFLAGSAKFSRTYHTISGWNNRCRFVRNSSTCPTGRALLSFGWITFGLLSALLLIVILHGILREKELKHEQESGDTAQGRQIEQQQPNSTNSQATAVVGGKHQEGGGGPTMAQVPQASPPVATQSAV
ncbi:hypothetical protein JCM5350_007409 [Sporobolomyces pararoseus]